MRPGRTCLMAGCLLTIGMMVLGSPAGAAPPQSSEESHTHPYPYVVTEDAELQAQIVKVHEGLEILHREMADRRTAIQQNPNKATQAALYAELDGLRREHDMLERLLHDLVEEAKATKWTKIDEALKRARAFERYQEKASKREEDLRERQQ